MAALRVARLDDRELLLEAAADLVVTLAGRGSLLRALAEGRLEERRAVELLAALHRQPPSVWTLAYDNFDPARQGLREALCALGNGYFVTRGALPEAEADGVNYPGTYVAGLYDRASTEIAGASSRTGKWSPNWLPHAVPGSDGTRATGSTSSGPTSSSTVSSSTCSTARSPGSCARNPRAGGPAWSSAGW